MSFDLSAIRSGVKSALTGINGLRVYDVIPSRDLVVPAAVVQPDVIRYQEAFKGGLVEAHIKITVLVSSTDAVAGQKSLDGFLSAGTGMTNSIVDALEHDNTFGGVVDGSGILTDYQINYGLADVNGAIYWRADVMLKVLRTRS